MREPVFDAVDRHDQSPAEHNEPTFTFLNRVAGQYWEHARLLIQSWAERIDADAEYHDLRQRFRSRDNDQLRSAFLELYLHQSLVRAGYAVTMHPAVLGTSRRPDFLGVRAGERLYVEAISPGTAPAAKAAASRRGVLFDTVDRLRHPHFMLWLESLEEGESPPSAARLREGLRHWLDGLDPDAITDIQTAPLWSWTDGGWRVTFRPIPKRPDARGVRPADRSIGVYGHTAASLIDDAPAIRRALAEKHHAYGDLAAPFVIAVGTYIHDTDRWHSTNALYGNYGIQWHETPGAETVTREVRQAGGYFGQAPDWQNRNVSAVLIINQLMPYSVPRAETTLWRHPQPIHPLPADEGLPGESLELSGTTLSDARPPRSPEQFFGLPDPWPPGEAWPNE